MQSADAISRPAAYHCANVPPCRRPGEYNYLVDDQLADVEVDDGQQRPGRRSTHSPTVSSGLVCQTSRIKGGRFAALTRSRSSAVRAMSPGLARQPARPPLCAWASSRGMSGGCRRETPKRNQVRQLLDPAACPLPARWPRLATRDVAANVGVSLTPNHLLADYPRPWRQNTSANIDATGERHEGLGPGLVIAAFAFSGRRWALRRLPPARPTIAAA